MARYIAILEDDARRREAMEALLCRRLSELKIAFFTASQAMNDWLAAHFDEVAIASLDHDLELLPGEDRRLVDQGCGRDVVDNLIQRPAISGAGAFHEHACGQRHGFRVGGTWLARRSGHAL